MEKGKGKKVTVKTSKKDPLRFRVTSKTGFIVKSLILSGEKGISLSDIVKEIRERFPGSPNERITRGTVKTVFSDFSLLPGTFTGSRGIELSESNGVYKIKDPEVRKKLRKEYRDFYLLDGKKKKGK